MENIKLIRLITGEDIISQCIETYLLDTSSGKINEEMCSKKQDSITLIEPLKLIYAIGGSTGLLSVSLMSWIFPKLTDKVEIEIKERDILFITEPSEKFIQHYIETIESFKKIEENNQNKDFESLEETDIMNRFEELLQPSLDKRKLH